MGFDLMSTLAVEKAFKTEILPSWTGAGHPLSVRWDPTTKLVEAIEAGARADVLVLIDAPMAKMAEAGIVLGDTITPIARAGIGLGKRAGSAMPDISTADSFRQALLDAKSIAYSLGGASGIYFGKLIQTLGIADQINAKAVTIPAGFTAEKVISGEAEMAVQQISELMSVDGIGIVGPFPPEYQVATDFSVAIFADAANPDAARDFLRHLTTDAARAAYARGGLAPRF